MNERALIDWIRGAGTVSSSWLKQGIGDDCAVLRGDRKTDWLVTTDFLIEGVHFDRAGHTAADCGWKALARGLSDIAAMGGEPALCFVSLAVPDWAGSNWVRQFYAGLLGLAKQSDTALAGGDLTRAPLAICDVIVLGRVSAGRALLRSGARAGDGIYVTGQLGGSQLGLERRSGAAWRRHLRPQPRLEAGKALWRMASAAMDISDGLALDLARLCEASGVSAALEDNIPLFPGATLQQALGGGEDYELLFTAGSRKRVPAILGGVSVSRIGTIRSGNPGGLFHAGKRLRPTGWDPFGSR